MLDLSLLRRVARRQESIPAGELLAVSLLDLLYGGEIGAVHLRLSAQPIVCEQIRCWALRISLTLSAFLTHQRAANDSRLAGIRPYVYSRDHRVRVGSLGCCFYLGPTKRRARNLHHFGRRQERRIKFVVKYRGTAAQTDNKDIDPQG